ncbi:hypothetical protein CEXT_159331 [Caerostris extrusa]|uniref:Uncharacterized protein n=1 Tax=Caerostris extrusa TaxID=172846 RepID=A0AAV4V8E3_CAEEX|nr:hypothetical protein CEXT_159331 [Caerostris extrusa]
MKEDGMKRNEACDNSSSYTSPRYTSLQRVEHQLPEEVKKNVKKRKERIAIFMLLNVPCFLRLQPVSNGKAKETKSIQEHQHPGSTRVHCGKQQKSAEQFENYIQEHFDPRQEMVLLS